MRNYNKNYYVIQILMDKEWQILILLLISYIIFKYINIKEILFIQQQIQQKRAKSDYVTGLQFSPSSDTYSNMFDDDNMR